MKKLMTAFISIALVATIMLIVINRLNAAQGYSGADTLTVFNWEII